LALPTTRSGLFGSTAIAVSFWGAAETSWSTVTAGAVTDVPSRELVRTFVGVIGAGAATEVSPVASCSTQAEKRTWRPAVPLSEATLPARVEMSYSGAGAMPARVERIRLSGTPIGIRSLRPGRSARSTGDLINE